jgi:guanylate kinase
MEGKVIIFSAPSGAGKTTIVKHILNLYPEMEFSISACSREKRPNETDGKDYFFISADEFRNKIEKGEFVEWEEVYEGCYYGTLRSELSRIWKIGHVVVFDVDVKGGINLKRIFGEKALSVFISPPDLETLEQRLRNRSTDSEESLNKRLNKASWEMQFSNSFDKILFNKDLKETLAEAERLVKEWIS